MLLISLYLIQRMVCFINDTTYKNETVTICTSNNGRGKGLHTGGPSSESLVPLQVKASVTRDRPATGDHAVRYSELHSSKRLSKQ